MEVEVDMKNTLFIVIPCYNEEEVLDETVKEISKKMNELISKKQINKNSKVMFVNDGSRDKTWSIIKKYSKSNKLITGISLSRNRGHQNALVAGLLSAKDYADVVISMDADLQDDINAIDKMLDKYMNGCEIVYGVRSARKKDTFFKKHTAQMFYKFMSKMGVDIVYNHADYRLTSKRVLEEFSNYKEKNLFLRGIFPLIGFKNDIVYYERGERFAGESKYPLKKMINFAWDGITSFSVKPIRFIMGLGLFQIIISFILIVLFIILDLNRYSTLGIGSILSIISFFFGIQLFCTGIIGDYIGKVYFETKNRPRFIIEDNLMEDEHEK